MTSGGEGRGSLKVSKSSYRPGTNSQEHQNRGLSPIIWSPIIRIYPGL